MNKEQLQKRHLAICEEMTKLDEKANAREAKMRALAEKESQDEKEREQIRQQMSALEDESRIDGMKYDALMREDVNVASQLRGMATNAELSKIQESDDNSAQLREYYKGLMKNQRDDVTLTFVTKSTPDGTSIKESGAVILKINDVMDTKLEGLGLPTTLTVLTGVTGDEVWPVNINDAVMEEVGEIQPVNEQAIKFDNIKAVSQRVSLAIGVSRKAIEFAAFDLYAYVIFKIRKALTVYYAKKVYSHANWSGNKGPFSLVTPGNIDLSTDAFKKILIAAADMGGGIFDETPVFTIDKYTEAVLKATPKAQGQGGFIIENGLLAGFPYTVSNHINKTLDTNEYVDETDAGGYKKHFLGIGIWEYFALQQHGTMTLVTDATSAAVAKANKVVSVFSTEISMTELSSKINGNTGNAPQAFALYELSF